MNRLSIWLGGFLAFLCLVIPGAALAQETDANAAPKPPLPPEIAQPSYDVVRIDDGGFGRPYRVWEEWVPQIVATPDGGGWIFFTAQPRADEGYGDRRLFASRFDPDSNVWLPARPLGSPSTQFGVSAGVDSKGVVHLIYSQRSIAEENAWSQLVYQRFVDGAWTEPSQIAPDPNAGHQMLPALAIGAEDALHVVWRDQRFVSDEERNALPTNADLLASDFIDGEWTAPMRVSTREAPDLNPAWPHLVADGDRLVVVWSIYEGTTAEEMKSAARVEWSERTLEAGSEWSAPQVLFERTGADAGGRLVDLAADPRGGAVVIYGQYSKSNNELFLQRLEAGNPEWSDPVLLSTGDFGYLPTAAIAPDGTIYTVFNNGRNRDVDIGGLVADPSGVTKGAVTLTPGEGGVTARASISLDRDGTPWVVYLHQPVGSTNVTEIQAIRSATFQPPDAEPS